MLLIDLGRLHQRAGDYVIKWGEELEKQWRGLESRRPQTSTLTKRPAKSVSQGDDAGGHAAKKVKTEAGFGDAAEADEEFRMHYEKGTISNVCLV